MFRRAGFGALPRELTTAANAGYDATVSTLVAGLAAPDTAADAIVAPTFSPPLSVADRESMDAASRRALARQLHEEFLELTTWWLSRMLVTSNPLKEKLTFLLHNQFPTAISKVRYPLYMYTQNQLFRTRGSGDFTALTQAVAQDPAMLIWLDAKSNKKSNPNENFARELMERFTMGVGTYTQADVRAASYCFTGWRLNPQTGAFEIQARQHSTAPQKFLGVSGVTSGQQVIDIVTHSDASSTFVPARFWSFLAYPVTPRDPVVADLAPGYAAGPQRHQPAHLDLPPSGVHADAGGPWTGQTANRVRGGRLPRTGRDPGQSAQRTTRSVGARLRRARAGAVRSTQRRGVAAKRLLALDRLGIGALDVRPRTLPHGRHLDCRGCVSH